MAKGLDFGVPAFLIQATLVGKLSQRLVRKICPHCKEAFEMEAAELLQMGLATRQSGTCYHGRVAISQGMISLRENAVIKLLGGETTYQEVLRVTWEQI